MNNHYNLTKIEDKYYIQEYDKELMSYFFVLENKNTIDPLEFDNEKDALEHLEMLIKYGPRGKEGN